MEGSRNTVVGSAIVTSTFHGGSMSRYFTMEFKDGTKLEVKRVDDGEVGVVITEPGIDPECVWSKILA